MKSRAPREAHHPAHRSEALEQSPRFSAQPFGDKETTANLHSNISELQKKLLIPLTTRHIHVPSDLLPALP